MLRIRSQASTKGTFIIDWYSLYYFKVVVLSSDTASVVSRLAFIYTEKIFIYGGIRHWKFVLVAALKPFLNPNE